MRIGTGYDVHQFSLGRDLILGGVNVPSKKGLLGHSDADVLSHAIGDAILGAACLGDLGTHFSDKDPRWKNISSLTLLSQISALVDSKELRIGNIDSTLILQSPKVKEYIPSMRSNLAEALLIDIEQISVKATTTEKLGFVGREEGVAAEAIALLVNK